MKEHLYNIISGAGIWTLSKLFPEYFAKDPLRPTDRYIEYPFALKNIHEFSGGMPNCILDVGCTASMFPYLLQSIGHDVTGIDIRNNYEMLEDFKFYSGSINKTSFPGLWFDVITAISTIEHIGLGGRYGADIKDTDKDAIDEIYRILSDRGLFIMTVPFGDRYKVNRFHRIYDYQSISKLLSSFNYVMDIVKSPEEGKIALIKATKKDLSFYPKVAWE